VATAAGFGIYAAIAFVLKVKPNLGSFRRRLVPILVKYGLLAALGALATFVLISSNRFFLNNYLGAASVGLFMAYTSASNFISGQLRLMFIQIFFPTISKFSDISAVYQKLTQLFRLTLVPLTIANAVIIFIIIYFYGEKYELSLSYALLFGFNSTLYLFAEIMRWLNSSRGISGIQSTVVSSSLFAAVNIALNIIMIQFYGFYGAIIVSIITSVALWVMFDRWTKKYLAQT
jgi:O-antigen/teichoic acid export membrane protein